MVYLFGNICFLLNLFLEKFLLYAYILIIMEGKSIWYYIGIPLLIIAFIFKLASRLFKDKLGNFPLFQYVGGIFLIVIGFFIIIAIYEQYDYFVEDYKYRFFKKIFRETGVKIFYYLLGALIITMGFFVLSN